MAPVTAQGAEAERRRRQIEELSAIERASASAGEERSAEWIAAELRGLGASPRIETEAAVGSYWLPFGLLSLLSLAGGVATWRGRRTLGVLSAGIAGAALIDDLALGLRGFRRLIAKRRTSNVLACFGPQDSERTLIFIAHHDAARSGFIFNPSGGEAIARRAPWLLERLKTAPPIFWPVIAGPAGIAVGGLLRRNRLTALGAGLSLISLAAFLDVGRHRAVPGAIDNASGVIALLTLGRRLVEKPPKTIRVVLLFTGGEEALWEGIDGFARRHFKALPTDRTAFINVDQVGDQFLNLLSAEGPVKLRPYSPELIALLEQVAEEAGIELRFPNLRGRSGGDSQRPLKAGYPTAYLQSLTEHKLETAYHWPTDTPDKVNYATLASAVDLCEAAVRRVDERWIGSESGQ